MRQLLIATTLLQLLVPAHGSVHVRELKNGNYRVSSYNDGSPKITVTLIYTEKTKKVAETRTVKDKTNKIYTPEGKKIMSTYWDRMNAWRQEPRDIGAGDDFPEITTKGQYYCGVSGFCPGPEGEAGRPIKPKLSEGVHFKYGTKQETIYVTRPNPKYGKVREQFSRFSDRARNPGGLPFIGSTEQMTPGEYREYWHYITR